MNEQFSELVGQLLKDNFQEELYTIKFGGKAGEIKIVPFDGYTKSTKRFWGKLELADHLDLINWIEINIDGKSHRFDYKSDTRESFFGQ